MAILGAPVRGMERGKLLSLRSRVRESLFQSSLSSPLKSGGFCGNFGCSVRGMERGSRFFRACFARLSKLVVFVAILGAPVRGM